MLGQQLKWWIKFAKIAIEKKLWSKNYLSVKNLWTQARKNVVTKGIRWWLKPFWNSNQQAA